MITVTFVPEHFNANANHVIPEYWTPNVQGLGNCQTWPCESEQEAIELGEQLVRDGLAEA